MTASTLDRPADVSRRVPEQLVVTAYVHQATRSAWLDVAGKPLVAPSLRNVIGQLRRAHRRIPRGIEVVGVDLTGFDEITIDLAVFLSLESRMLGVRGLRLAVALRDEITTRPGAQQMLSGLQIWRLDEDGLKDLAHAVAHARLEEQGWLRLGARTPTQTIAAE